MRFGAQMIATRGQPRALARLGSQRPSGVVVPVALPQLASIVTDFITDSITPVADGTLIGSWTDSVGSATITNTGTARPAYKVNRYGGKPTLLCSGAQYLFGSVPAANTALTAGEISMLVVFANTQTTSFGFLANLTNSTGFNISANGSVTGVAVANGVEYAASGFSTAMFTLTQNYNGLSAARSPFFVNGQCVGTALSTAFTPTSFGVGASATGIGGAKAEILRVIIWNRRLTAYEAVQAEMAVRDYYSQPYPWAGQAYLYMGTGDSLTFGYGTTDTPKKAFPRLLATRFSLPVGCFANHGYVGASPGTVNTIVNGERLKDITTLTGMPVKFSYFEFYNQRGVGNSTAVTNTQAVLSNIKSVAGNKVCFGTTTDYGVPARGAEKTAWTSYWDTPANRTGYMDAYVAIHSNSNVGVDGAAPSAAPFGHYFRNQVNSPVALTGASITSGTATLTTTNDVLTAGCYVDNVALPTDTYVVTRNSAGNYTLSANATATLSSVAIAAASMSKGDGIHMGDGGHVEMATLWDALNAM